MDDAVPIDVFYNPSLAYSLLPVSFHNLGLTNKRHFICVQLAALLIVAFES